MVDVRNLTERHSFAPSVTENVMSLMWNNDLQHCIEPRINKLSSIHLSGKFLLQASTHLFDYIHGSFTSFCECYEFHSA